MTKQEIQKEADLIFKYLLETARQMKTNHVQSWWLNKRNCPELWKETPVINRRLKLLVKQGKLKIDEKNTSTSKGTSYIIL